MADELKTEEVKSQIEEKKIETEDVTISQEKLNSLINEKFKKGAEKSKNELLSELGVESLDDLKSIVQAKAQADESAKTELQKAQELIEAERNAREKKEAELNQLLKKNSINEMALKHGVDDVEYFGFQLEKAKAKEDFNESEFIESLKESKPFVFGQKQTPKTDNTGNNGDNPSDLASLTKGLSLKQLKELQKQL